MKKHLKKTHLLLMSLECWPQSANEWYGNGRIGHDAPLESFVAEQQRKEYGRGIPCWIARNVY